ncbi:MAG: hypothetical protein OWT27_00650 [Firmicutes bacterium]|nr:hypothetical protein [Bacillota bacterium]
MRTKRGRGVARVAAVGLVLLSAMGPSAAFAAEPTTDSHYVDALGGHDIGYYGVFDYDNGSVEPEIDGGEPIKELCIDSAVDGRLRALKGIIHVARKRIDGGPAYQFDYLGPLSSDEGGYDVMSVDDMTSYWEQSGANTSWINAALVRSRAGVKAEWYGGGVETVRGYYSTTDLWNLGGWTLGPYTLTPSDVPWPKSELPAGTDGGVFASETLSPTMVPAPVISATVSDANDLVPGHRYTADVHITSPGSSGGYSPHSLMAAFWVPSGSTIAIQDTDLSASGASYASIPSVGWPSPIAVAHDGAMSPLHNGYPGGIPGGTSGDNTPGIVFSSLLSAGTTVPVTVQMPSDWPGDVSSGDLVLYYGDGIDRYDAQSIPIHLAASAQCSPPSFPLLSDTADGTQEAPGGSTSVEIGGRAGETVSLSVSGGTFAGGATSETVTVGSDGTVQTTVDETTGVPTVVTATACGATATDTVHWTPPTLTLSANPTSLTVGGTSTLTVQSSEPLGSDQEIDVHDLSGDNTLSGSDVRGVGLGAQSGTVSATDNVSQTVEYEAAVSEDGTTIDSNRVDVTWNAASAPKITLRASPTSLTTGGTATLCVSESGAKPTTIYVHDLSGDDTLSGCNVQSLGAGVATGTVSATDNLSQTATYVAAMPWYGTTIDSNEVSITWDASTCTAASFPQASSNGVIDLSAASGPVQIKGAPDQVVHLSLSGGTFAGGVTSKVIELSSYGYDDVDVHGDGMSNNMVLQAKVACGAESSVDISIPIPKIVLSAGTTQSEADTPIKLTASATDLAPSVSYTIEIQDDDGKNTLGGSNEVDASGIASTSGALSFATDAISSAALTDSYVATLVDASTGAEISSNTVTVSWFAPGASTSPAITLTAQGGSGGSAFLASPAYPETVRRVCC